MPPEVNLTISQEIVYPIIEAKIQAAVTEAMRGADHLVSEMVNTVLNAKVNHEGKVSNYSSDNRYTFVYVIMRKAIQDAVGAAVLQEIESNKDKIRDEIRRQIASAKTRNQMVAAFLECITKTAESKRFNFDVSLRAD